MRYLKQFSAEFFLGLLCLLLFIECVVLINIMTKSANPAADTQPRVITETLDPSLIPVAHYWRDEVGRRFNHAIVIEAHGGTFIDGHWIIAAGWTPWERVVPVEEVIKRYRALYPDRTIVLASCNPAHVVLHGFPNVYYAHSSVWIVPDRALTPDMFLTNGIGRIKLQEEPFHNVSRSDEEPDVVGNIYEFTEAL